jgi:hypothetical protein
MDAAINIGFELESGEPALRRECKRLGVSLYLNAGDRRHGRPHVHLRSGSIGLGSFRDCRTALQWLVPQEVAHAV